MAIGNLIDHGTVYNISGPTNGGAGLTNGTYIAGAAFLCALSDMLTVQVVYAFDGAGATQYDIKLQGTLDGTTWSDLQSTNQLTGVTTTNHTVTAAGNTLLQTSSNFGCLSGARVAVKATTATLAADNVTCKATSGQRAR